MDWYMAILFECLRCACEECDLLIGGAWMLWVSVEISLFIMLFTSSGSQSVNQKYNQFIQNLSDSTTFANFLG